MVKECKYTKISNGRMYNEELGEIGVLIVVCFSRRAHSYRTLVPVGTREIPPLLTPLAVALKRNLLTTTPPFGHPFFQEGE